MFYSSKLIAREEVAHETLAVRIERPAGFTFLSGEYVDLTIRGLEERDALGPIRSLSIASPPQADYLEFILRQRETAFKRALAAYPLGTELELEGPFNNLKLDPESERKQVFIAGGIGVAPFLSAVRGAALAGRGLRATLFYANQRPEDAVALDELERLQGEIPGFRLVTTMTRMAESARPWTGETERLGVPLFERYLPALIGPAYFIAGAPTLITELRMALLDAGVGYDDIRIELFTGY